MISSRNSTSGISFFRATICMLAAMAVLLAFPWDSMAGEVIKIGVIGPMKFSHGRDQWAGAELAAEEINAAGGILVGDKKCKIELVKADSNGLKSVPDAISAMERLMSVDEVDFVVGGTRSEAVLGMQDVVTQYKKVFINVGAAHPELTGRVKKNYKKYKYFFRFGSINSYLQIPLHVAALKMVVEKVRKDLGVETPKVAFLAEKVMWADPLYKLLQKLEADLNIKMVGEWRPSYTAGDITAELTDIKASGAHIIYTGFSGPVATIFSKQWGELEIPAAAIGVNMLAQELDYWDKTGGMGEYEAYWTNIARVKITDKTIPFMDKFIERYKMFPSVYAQTYDAVYFLQDAIGRAGTTDADAVVKALEEIDYEGVSGRVNFYKESDKWPHDMVWGPKTISNFYCQWIDGKQVAVWPPPGGEWEGVQFEGSEYYQLPPWMIKYWKAKK